MDPAHLPALGTIVRRHRVAARLTQEELAERAGVSVRTISDIERGLIRQSRRDTLAQLAEALSLSDRERAALDFAARQQPNAATTPRPHSSLSPGEPTLPPLLGRARELALLERHLEGEGPAVLALAGEPGIGKTRLLCATAGRAREQGWAVLEGGCQRRGGQEPYTPLLGAIARTLAQRSAARRKLDLQGCAWLVRLLPELAETSVVPVPTWSLPPSQERRLMFAAARRYLTNIAGPAGTLVVLDDLQWAGQDALDLLATLVRAPDGEATGGIRAVIAYRSTEVRVAGPLGMLVGDLTREGLAARIEIGPLGPEAAADLLAALLTDLPGNQDALRDRLAARAGGVPYFLVSCAQAVRGDVYGQAPGEDQLPWNVAESIRQRINLTSEPVRALLPVLAVCGREAPIPMLLAVASRIGQKRLQTLAALDTACHAGLLVEQRGDAYAFAHDLIRDVVAADLGAAQRHTLHRLVAGAIERAPAPERHAAELAWHFSRSGDPVRALPYALLAGDHAEANYAHAEAEHHYRAAIELARELGDQTRESDALEALAGVFHFLARYDEALQVYEQVLGACRATGDIERMARLVEQMGDGYAHGLRQHEGIPRLWMEIASLSQSGLSAAGLARLHAALAVLFVSLGRYAELLEDADQAIEFARSAGDLPVLLKAQTLRGAALIGLDRVAEAAPALRELIPQAEAAAGLGPLTRVLMHLTEACALLGELEEGRAYCERGCATAQLLGEAPLIAKMRSLLGANVYWAGDWAEARLQYQRGVAALGQIDRSSNSLAPALGLGQLLVAQGSWEEADQLLGNVTAHAERVGDLEPLERALAVLAEWDLVQGRVPSAHARLIPLLARYPSREVPLALLWLWAWVCLDRGNTDQADDALKHAIARARAHSHRLALADSQRVAAILATRQERWDEAESALEEALSSGAPYPYAQAKALFIAGELDAARGDLDRAREHYKAARAILTHLGERLYAEQVDSALHALR